MPVVVRVIFIIRSRTINHKVKGGIIKTLIEAEEDILQHPGKFSKMRRRKEAKGGAVHPGKNPGFIGYVRGIRMNDNKIVRLSHDSINCSLEVPVNKVTIETPPQVSVIVMGNIKLPVVIWSYDGCGY